MITADYAQIEARVMAYYAGLDDAEGPLIRHDVARAIRLNARLDTPAWARSGPTSVFSAPVYLPPHFGTPRVLHYMGSKPTYTMTGRYAQAQNLPRFQRSSK